jgi:hypothetical protein
MLDKATGWRHYWNKRALLRWWPKGHLELSSHKFLGKKLGFMKFVATKKEDCAHFTTLYYIITLNKLWSYWRQLAFTRKLWLSNKQQTVSQPSNVFITITNSNKQFVLINWHTKPQQHDKKVIWWIRSL